MVTTIGALDASATGARPEQALRRTREPAAMATAQEDRATRVGPVDQLTADQVLELIAALPQWERVPQSKRATVLRAASVILDWLQQHPGDGWQARWQAAGADRDTGWLDEIVDTDPRTTGTKRSVMTNALAYLLLCRVVLPEYGFLSRYRARSLYSWTREVLRPDLFAQLEQAGRDLAMLEPQIDDGIRAITRMVLHTGRDVDQLAVDDVHEHREWFYRGLRGADRGVHAAWDLLQGIGVIPADASLRSSLRHGQRSTEELVDFYQIQAGPIRDVLVRYLNERRASLDYSSLKGLAMTLAGLFWADIERHHPGLDTLRLPPEVVEGWKQRLSMITTSAGETKPRKDFLRILATVRAFYLDIQEWAFEDPSWAQWAAPSPVRRRDLAGMAKERKRTVSAMHQRVRERLPHLSVLVNSAEDHKNTQANLLGAARGTPLGRPSAMTASPTCAPPTSRTRRTGPLGDRTWCWSRTSKPDIRSTSRRPRTTHSGPGRSSKRYIAPESGSRSCWRSPTWHWSPTGCQTPGSSSRSCRLSRRRTTKNACC